MGQTRIEWATDTWNPVVGCTKVSPGCQHCYAERVLRRLRPHAVFSDVVLHPERSEDPLHWKKPRRIFVCSMSDLFHSSVPTEFVAHVVQVMRSAPWHVFMVLTKRPGRLLSLSRTDNRFQPWPPNVWVGTSLESMYDGQRRLTGRLDLLVQIPAAVHFLSAEPLLGPLDIYDWLYCGLGALDWVIVGGESGPKARPMELDWVRSLRDQCVPARVAFFFKQARQNGRMVSLPLLDGKRWAEFPEAWRQALYAGGTL